MNKNYDYGNRAESKKVLGEIHYTIARRLKYIRELHKMTQVELGRRIGVSGTSISSYEIPYCEIPLENLRKISNVFKVEISYFTTESESEDLAQRLHQVKTCNQVIPYFKNSNISGILLNDMKTADGCLTLPRPMTQGINIICTDIPDNAMINLQYKQGELIFVDRDAIPANGSITLLYDPEDNKLILRKYMCEGPMVTLIADGHGDIAPIYINITDSPYKVIGPVIRSTRDC